MQTDEKIRIVQIVGQLLLSDMALSAEESDFLDALMGRYELTEGDRKAVFGGINIGNDPALAVAELSADSRAELLTVLHEAAHSDGVIEPVEAELIALVEAAVAVANG